MVQFSADDVLDYLEQRDPTFLPDLGHPYCYHVDARLTGYANETDWAITIEQLGVNPRAGGHGIATTIYAHGTSVVDTVQPSGAQYCWLATHPVEEVPGQLLMSDVEEVNPAAAEMLVRGKPVPIRTDAAFYGEHAASSTMSAGEYEELVEMKRKYLTPDQFEQQRPWLEALAAEVGQFKLRPWLLLRGHAPTYREQLLATDAERRSLVGHDLPLVLQLDDWRHPKLMDGETPRDCRSFREIAKCLADPASGLPEPGDEAGDEAGNIHWSNWPESGSL